MTGEKRGHFADILIVWPETESTQYTHARAGMVAISRALRIKILFLPTFIPTERK